MPQTPTNQNTSTTNPSASPSLSSSSTEGTGEDTVYHERIARLEMGQSMIEARMVKYDEIVVELRRNTERHDMLLTTFIDEMKEMKAHDVSVNKLLQDHENTINTTSRHVNNAVRFLNGAGVLVGGGLISLILQYLFTHVFGK